MKVSIDVKLLVSEGVVFRFCTIEEAVFDQRVDHRVNAVYGFGVALSTRIQCFFVNLESVPSVATVDALSTPAATKRSCVGPAVDDRATVVRAHLLLLQRRGK
jgi:hypothetical protein